MENQSNEELKSYTEWHLIAPSHQKCMYLHANFDGTHD